MYKLFLVFIFVNVKCDELNPQECDKLGILLYEDLRCTPQTAENRPCPTHYRCEFEKSKKYCHFQSEQIPVNKNVNDTLIYGSCRVGCRCIYDEHRRNDTAVFNCAVLDCPENFEVSNPDCYLTYKSDECCATGQKCPPFGNLTKCVFDGNEYREGEQFYPANSCLDCVCMEGFAGKLEAPYCRRRTCAEEIDSLDKLVDNCAPVYLGNDSLCCPSKWVCASDSDKIRQIGSKSANSGLTCRWGKQTLKLGEGLETRVEHFGKVEDITCECVLPPLLTCKKTKK